MSKLKQQEKYKMYKKRCAGLLVYAGPSMDDVELYGWELNQLLFGNPKVCLEPESFIIWQPKSSPG